MFPGQVFFNSNEHVINEGPAFLAKHLQRSQWDLAVISNFHHRRSHGDIELENFRL